MQAELTFPLPCYHTGVLLLYAHEVSSTKPAVIGQTDFHTALYFVEC